MVYLVGILTSFDLADKQSKKVRNYANLQPLLAPDHAKKTATDIKLVLTNKENK